MKRTNERSGPAGRGGPAPTASPLTVEGGPSAPSSNRRRQRPARRVAIATLTILASLAVTNAASAQTPPEDAAAINDYCFGCHEAGNILIPLPSGEILNASVPRSVFEKSIHGQIGMTCLACHSTIGSYPHEKFSALSVRDASIRLYTSCLRCHESEYTDTLDNMHSEALAG